jgi:hypothetical protein
MPSHVDRLIVRLQRAAARLDGDDAALSQACQEAAAFFREEFELAAPANRNDADGPRADDRGIHTDPYKV